MKHKQQPAYVLTSEAGVPASPDAVVLLDAGPESTATIWDRVVQSIASLNVLIVAGHYSPAPVNGGIAGESVVTTIRRIEQQHPTIDRRVFVGSKSGCHPIQQAIIEYPMIATDLILIDPDPLDLNQQLDEPEDSETTDEPIHIPTAIIMHGASSPANSDPQRTAAQEREFRRFSTHRVILAGRSRSCILSERPDVVVDALTSALARESSST